MSNRDKTLLVHIDLDSPRTLLRFYKINNVEFSSEKLDRFYCIAFDRMIDFFEKKNIKPSLFIVGSEVEKSKTIQGLIQKVHHLGYEIENHTYSHPFGLTKLSKAEIENEITKCNEVISSVVGDKPIGFRSPGYNINTSIINLLESMGFQYDSSGFWSILNTVLKASQNLFYKNGLNNADFGSTSGNLKQIPYHPSKENWLMEENDRNILELPLPRGMMGLPFYNNFNLYAPSFYGNLLSKNMNRDFILYLFHMIEFVDLTDDIPSELQLHPAIKLSVKEKIKKSERVLSNLLNQYSFVKTRDYVHTLAV